MGSYSLGGYASWEHESGFYLDGVVKLNRFKSNVAGKMSSGGAANGSYSHSAGVESPWNAVAGVNWSF